MRVIGRKWFTLLTVDGWKGCLTGVQDKYFQNDEWGTGSGEEFEAVAVIEDSFLFTMHLNFILISNFGIEWNRIKNIGITSNLNRIA